MTLTGITSEYSNALNGLDKEQADTLTNTILTNPYIKQIPTPKQVKCLVSGRRELLYGGAAGGGKSSVLLMGALQYMHQAECHSIILRKSYTQLIKADALIPRSMEWLKGTDAEWREGKKMWTFPNGGTLEFGHLETEVDKYNYQGAAYDYIGFDELTQFTESQYTYLFSRLGRNPGIPARLWSASNPGGTGHDWVKRRFIGRDNFYPALLEDNPFIATGYEMSLKMLDPVTHRQLRFGDWDVSIEGDFFKRTGAAFYDVRPKDTMMRQVRFWDCAGTEAGSGKDPDYTVGLLLGEYNGEYYACDLVRGQWSPSDVERVQAVTAQRDGVNVDVYEEEEPGSSGKAIIAHKARDVFRGYPYRGVRTSGDKITRAKPVAGAWDNGLIKLPKGAAWVDDFLHELVSFPNGGHDDQVDALSGAFNQLREGYGDGSRFLDAMYVGGGKHGR